MSQSKGAPPPRVCGVVFAKAGSGPEVGQWPLAHHNRTTVADGNRPTTPSRRSLSLFASNRSFLLENPPFLLHKKPNKKTQKRPGRRDSDLPVDIIGRELLLGFINKRFRPHLGMCGARCSALLDWQGKHELGRMW